MKGQYIAAGAIIGVGLGFLFDNMTAFSILGVGVGFLAGIILKK